MYKQRKIGKIVLAIFIILFVLGAGAGAYYFFVMKGGEKPTEVTVSLELNGGAFSETPYGFTEENGVLSKVFKIGEAYGYMPEPTKGGYAFVGWSLTGEEPCIESADVVENDSAFTLYAVWEVERIYTYKVYYAIYDADTGAVYSSRLAEPQTGTAYNRSTIRPEIKKFDGYTYFDGTTKDGKTSDVPAKLNYDNMNLFIYYVANTYTIKYSYSTVGATSEFVTTFKYSTDVVNLAKLRKIADIQNADARFIVSGMTFSHWCTNGKTYNDQANVTRADLAEMGFSLDLTNGGVDEITLDALYKESTYNLSFVSQGNEIATDEVKFNALATEPTAPTSIGYEFVGWYTQEIGATGTQISEFTPVDFATFRMPSNDCTLYAGFRLINYTLTLDLGEYGYYENGTGNPTQYNIESNFVLIYPQTTLQGYEFIGWKSGDSTEITLDLNLNNMTGDRTYTAVYGEKTYHIEYELNGGTIVGVIDNPTTYTISTPDITLRNPEKRGYEFAGWRLDDETTLYRETIITQGSIGDRKYTAVFSPIEYNIYYDGIVGAEFTPEKTTFTVEDRSYTFDEPSLQGYAFAGWEFDGKLLENSTISFVDIYEDITITAKWNLRPYRISYELNGGTCERDNKTEFTIETETFLLNNPTKKDYIFSGWTGSLSEMPEKAVYVRQGEVFNDLTFVANYTPIEYAITYKNLDNCTFNGSESNPNVTNYNVETPTFTLINPEKRGYDFAGWQYTYNGQTQTKINMEIKAGAFSGDIEFIATFTAIKYTITLDKKDGSISSAALQVLKDLGIEVQNSSTIYYTVENDNFTLPQPTKGAFSFTGWKNLETQAVAVETIIDTNAATDLGFEALWNAKVYNITYELNGGRAPDGIVYPESYSFTSEDISPEKPIRAGYTCGDWELYKLDNDNNWVLLEDVKLISCKKDTGDRKFVVNWTANRNTQYTVEYRIQPLNGSAEKSDYVLSGTQEILRATTDTLVTKEAKGITGFTAEESSITLNINGDGSTKFVFYYSRNMQQISASAASGADGEGIESVVVSNDYGASGNGEYYYGQEITVTVNLKAGYTIKGIFENDKSISNLNIYKFTLGQEDRTFIAKANIVTYYISYYVDKGATFGGNATNPNQGTYTVKDSFTLVNPELAGSDFQGWSGTFISEDAKLKTVTISGMIGDLEFTAHFGENEYTINYDFNGGLKAENGIYPVRYKKSTPTIEPTTPVRLGYTFSDWTVLDESGSQIAGATTIPQGSFGDRTFVAHWTANTDTKYIVKHYYMNESGDFALTPDVTENLTGATDTEVTPAVKPRDGYNSPDTQTKTITGDGLMEIEYRYNRVAYSVTINKVGNGIDTISPLTVQYWGTSVTIEVVLKHGYYLESWTQTTGESVITEDNKKNTKLIFTMPKSDITLTIKTLPIEYKIEYTLSGGEMESGKVNPTSYTIESADFTLINPTMVGFEFLGWTSQDYSEPQLEMVVTTSTCKDLHFYARFDASKVNYIVKYYYMTTTGDYELGGTDNNQELAGETITIVPTARVGFTTPEAQTVQIKPDGSTVVEFRYTRNKYTITINGNDVNSGIATLAGAGEHYYGEKVTLSATLKELYNFIGWEKDGKVINESQEFEYELTEAKDVTFIARTKGYIYSITYEYGAAAADPIDNKSNPTEYEYGIGVKIADPTTYNYTFLGWQVTNSVDKNTYKNIEISATSSGNAVLKMHWGKINKTFSYMAKEDAEGYYLSVGRSAGAKLTDTIEIPDYVKITEIRIDSQYNYTYYGAVIVGEDYYELFDKPQDNGIYKIKEVYGRFYITGNRYYTNFMTFESSGIKNIKLGKFVEKIGEYAFANTKIETFIASDSLKTIDEGAFSYCNSLNSVTLNNVQTLGVGAFYKCPVLQSVNCGQLKEIGNTAFNECGMLQTIDFGAVETIGDYSFLNCDSLQTIDLKNVKTIGLGAFYNCDNLETISNAAKLSSIGTSVFAYSGSLINVDFSDSQLTAIPTSAFYNCFSLKNIKLPNTLTSIGNNSFYLCKSLREISIPTSVTRIGEYAFSFCEKLRRTGIDKNSKLQRIEPNAFQSCVSLIEITLPKTLTEIGAAFRNCSKLYQITNLTSFSNASLKNALFADAVNDLTSISKTGTFDNGTLAEDTTKKIYTLTYNNEKILVDYYGTDRNLDLSGADFGRIYRYAFYDLIDLQSVTLPDSLQKLGIYSFYKCRNLTKVRWLANISNLSVDTNGTTGYNVKMFVECSKLVQLELPDFFASNVNLPNWVDAINIGLEVIAHGGTYKNTLITNGDITTFKISSGDNAGTYFMGYSGTATSLDLSGYSKVYAGGLYGCATLQNVTLSKTLTEIPQAFFAHCWNLRSVTLPETVTKIGDNAFEECFRLPTVALSTKISTIGKYAFADCLSLNDIIIPEKVTKIEEKTFYGCFNLKKCKMSANVTSIGDYAFQSCALDYKEEGAVDYYFVLPKNCTISKNAFKQSREDLKTLYGED